MLTDRLAHVHIMRTGGTSFRSLLRKIPGLVIRDPKEWGQHTNFRKMSSFAYKNMPPGVAFVRHPKTWYLSCLCHVNQNASYGFENIGLREWLDYVETSGINRGPFNTMPLAAHWNWMGGDECRHVGKFENLYDDVETILLDVMPDLVSGLDIREMLATINEENNNNVVRRSLMWPDMKPLSEYNPDDFWDADLKERVTRWDGAFMKKWGYTW